MTDNQNMNKASMKDVQQQQHFLFKTASICVCLFVRFSVVSSRLMAFKTDELAFSKTFAN